MNKAAVQRSLAALALLGALHAMAAPAVPDPSCPAAADVQPQALLGLWHAEVEGSPRGATLLLEPHPRYAGSLSGEINRNGERARLAADLDAGEFTLEESSDGVHISATWLGDVVEGSCGREIRGSWQPEGGTAHPFMLRRL